MLNPDRFRAADIVPVGTVIAFAGNKLPSGWLKCDGSIVAKDEYPDLFEAIGTLHGTGDSDGQFRLPDYGGRFLRGVARAEDGRDSEAEQRLAAAPGGATGRNVGSVQDDAIRSHSHGLVGGTSGYIFTRPGQTGDVASNPQSGAGAGWWSYSPNTGTFGGAETRPQNAYVNFLIRAW
jgi:microcystin-dependent protein